MFALSSSHISNATFSYESVLMLSLFKWGSCDCFLKGPRYPSGRLPVVRAAAAGGQKETLSPVPVCLGLHQNREPEA